MKKILIFAIVAILVFCGMLGCDNHTSSQSTVNTIDSTEVTASSSVATIELESDFEVPTPKVTQPPETVPETTTQYFENPPSTEPVVNTVKPTESVNKQDTPATTDVPVNNSAETVNADSDETPRDSVPNVTPQVGYETERDS